MGWEVTKKKNSSTALSLKKNRAKQKGIKIFNNIFRPTTVSEHWLYNPNHTATDMQLIPIETIFSSRDSIRKAREATLIIRAKTIDPNGLNARDERH